MVLLLIRPMEKNKEGTLGAIVFNGDSVTEWKASRKLK